MHCWLSEVHAYDRLKSELQVASSVDCEHARWRHSKSMRAACAADAVRYNLRNGRFAVELATDWAARRVGALPYDLLKE